MDARLEVPIQVRELAVAGIDNAEKALALFFDNVAKSIAPNSAETIALLKRVIAVKMDYARKVARANDLAETAALQFAYCRSQVEITTDLIRIISDTSNKLSALCPPQRVKPRERNSLAVDRPTSPQPPPLPSPARTVTDIN